MRFAALATDYDGTLAHDGRVEPKTLDALARARESGRKLLLVTGRRLEDLFDTFDGVDAFDLVVAENGALVYDPVTKNERQVAEPPPPEFARALAARGVRPLDRGRVIVATLENHKTTVIDVIARLNLELQIIFNKGALMVLPAGVNKATGLAAALEQLGLSSHNVVAIGDAENDHAFLSACECGVAVANALPALKERSDIVTKGDHGDGVIELIDHLTGDDLASFADRLERHDLLLGTRDDVDVKVRVHGTNLLLAGPSGAGKSTLTTGIMERLVEDGYQVCVLDPEGDYQQFPKSVILGDAKHEPPLDQVLQALSLPGNSVIVNLVGVPLDNRPDYFERLVPALADLQSKQGRPHWIVADEAHHLAPKSRPGPAFPNIAGLLGATLDPATIAGAVLKAMTAVVALGDKPDRTIATFAGAVDEHPPELPVDHLQKGEAILWSRARPESAVRFKVAPCHVKRNRHSRKYAEAELTPDRSFYFRGPEEKLNLRASNLVIFVQMMQGVDLDTFAHHLKQHDYSRWFRENIKNNELAEEAERIENGRQPAEESRKAIEHLIEERYTLPG